MKTRAILMFCFRQTLALAAIAFALANPSLAQNNPTQQAKPRPAHVKTLSLPDDVAASLLTMPQVRVAAAAKDGIPTFLKGDIGTIKPVNPRAVAASDLAPVIKKVAAVFRLAEHDLTATKTVTDNLGFTHINYDQTKNGLPVVGTRLSVHVKRDGTVYAVTGNAHGKDNVPTVPTVSSSTATAIVHSWHAATNSTTSYKRLVYVVSTTDHEMHLAHEISNSGISGSVSPFRELVYVDAVDGRIVDCHSLIMPAEAIEVNYCTWIWSYEDQENYLAAILTRQLNPYTNHYITSSNNSACNTNFTYLDNAWNFYHDNFSCDSVDNSGLMLTSFVHYYYSSAHYPYNISGYVNNAYWDSADNSIKYGAGSGTHYKDWVSALDLTAHELTHGVTQFSSGLIYANEPGAINESMSDIMGASCNAYINGLGDDTWKFGKDLINSGAPDALRYMNDPTADYIGQYNPYSKDYYCDEIWIGPNVSPSDNNDYGWVHYNSGIGNLAFYLMVHGGQHPHAGASRGTGIYIPTTSVPSITLEHAQKIFYRANEAYLGPGSQYMDLREATVQATLDLSYGTTEATDVAIAWDVVGVPTFENRYPINMSTRGYVQPEGVMIAGFVLSGGSSAKTLLLRGVGPALVAAPFNLSGTLSDPQVSLMSGGSQIDYNDNWSSSSNASTIASTASAVGAFALANPSADTALLHSLSSGVYSMVMFGVSSTDDGIGLVEIYDTDAANPNHLVNLSTRAYIGTGDNVVIAGFVINGSGNKYLLIRGVGPALAASPFYMSGTIANPQIRLYDSSNHQLRSNSAWGTDENYYNADVSAEVAQIASHVRAFSLAAGSHDSALLVSLPAGRYTVVMSGVNNGTGIGLIEVYEVN